MEVQDVRSPKCLEAWGGRAAGGMWGFWELWGLGDCERRGFLRLGAFRRPGRPDVRRISGIRKVEQSELRDQPGLRRGIGKSGVSGSPCGRPPWGAGAPGSSGRCRGLGKTGRSSEPGSSDVWWIRNVRTRGDLEPLRRPEGSGDSAIGAAGGFGDWRTPKLGNQ